MNVLIFQYDDRGDLYGLANYNKKYAELHNYNYIFVSDGYDVPVYWQKVFLARKYINEYDIVIYIDSDARIINYDFSLENYLDNRSFYCNEDPMLKFNSGFFIVKNTEYGIKILEEWCTLFDKSKWYKNKKGIYKTNFIFCKNVYEQGSFIENILPKYQEHIKLEKKLMTFSINDFENSFIIHFICGNKIQRINAFNKNFNTK